METSILSTRKIVPVAGMDTTLLVVVVEVTIGALWMKLKLPYWYKAPNPASSLSPTELVF